MTDRAADIQRFMAAAGWTDAHHNRIAGDASPRKYDRVLSAKRGQAILMIAPQDDANSISAFVAIANHLRAHGLSTPRIYHQDIPAGLLLIEDFGDQLFADILAADPAQAETLYHLATDVLVHLRSVPVPPLPECTADWLIEMLDPLFEWYAPNVSNAKKATFQQGFRPFAQQAEAAEKIIMLRDYHAENLLMLADREGVARAGLLDFQDAMLAHPAYDLVSILQDARRDVSVSLEADVLTSYLSRTGQPAGDFRMDYAVLGLQRNLRILGIFARLCLRDGKAHYVDFIPRVWGYVQRNLTHPALTDLKAWLDIEIPAPTQTFLNQLKSRCPT